MNAASLFSSAQSLFGGSKLAASYTIGNAFPSGSGGSSNVSAASSVSGSSNGPEVIGLWTVQRATHKSNGKTVSIWTFDKAGLGIQASGGRYKGKAKLEPTLEVLKKEVSMLSRLRHPCVLEVVEALEETRSSLTFATEPVSSSLRAAITADERPSYRSRRQGSTDSSLGDLDEIEIQKGLLQIGKALQFLHDSANLVHCNLTPDAIVINSKGDWKLSGFGLCTYLASQGGEAPRWQFPDFDRQVPPEVQKDLDYMAPEYGLDEKLAPSNDMYSLGCIIYAIHTKAGPPFSNRHNMQNLRENMENLATVRATWHKLTDEVQDVLSQLLTRYPSGRLTASSFQTSRYFSSVLVSTLRYLDRDSFAAKPREEQASFLKGLLKVLPQFSDKVVKRKILPSLLEETRKNMLVPFLLPCIMYIADKMDNDEFKSALLPDLKPLFSMKDPPQAMLTLLDSLPMFNSKCNAITFREEVLPLVYNALDSDVPPLLERALKVIPTLSETLDYTTVKNLLLPKITSVFSKTTSLAVKVATLLCFRSLVPVLDKYTLTENLVPLLARIKTKEPSVMIATLSVHEQIGLKCDIQALATLVLPQLWAMSITPLLSADQFARFMNVIKQLGNRVEEEQTRHLQEVKRLEESSGAGQRVSVNDNHANGGNEVDFETLVRGDSSNGRSITPDPFSIGDDLPKFDNHSVSNHSTTSLASSSANISGFAGASRTSGGLRPSLPTSSAKAASLLGARPISAAAFSARTANVLTPDNSQPATPVLSQYPTVNSSISSIAALPPPMSPNSSMQRAHSSSNNAMSSAPTYSSVMSQHMPSTSSLSPPLQPSSNFLMAGSSMQTMQPTASSFQSSTAAAIQWNSAPSMQSIQQSRTMQPMQPMQPMNAMQPKQAQPMQAMQPTRGAIAPPGFSGGVLQPTKKETSYDWSDLDPMK